MLGNTQLFLLPSRAKRRQSALTNCSARPIMKTTVIHKIGLALAATLACASVPAQSPDQPAQVGDAKLLVADDGSAYVVSSDGVDAATADRLYKINLSTGAPTMIGALGPTGGVFEDVESLAFDASGSLFGIDDDTKTLVNINLATGRATAVAGLQGNTRLAVGANNVQDPSIAFSCAGDLYGAGRNSRSFYRVNTSTGAFEVLGAATLEGGITDLAYAKGKMYGLGETSLYSININNGQSALVGPYGTGINFSEGGGLASDSTGQLWAIAERRNAQGQLQPSQFYRINSDTGAATLAGSTTVLGIESLVIGTPNCTTQGQALVSVPSLSHWGAMLLMLSLGIFAVRFGKNA